MPKPLTMRHTLLLCTALLASPLAHAQPAADTWSNVPQAPDDRFTNPKSKLYAGPNGWFNFGELRADAGGKRYALKAGLQYMETPKAFLLTPSNQLQVATLDFGTATPAPGTYQVADKPDPAARKVHVSFADVSNQKIVEWQSRGASSTGSVVVTQANGFLYFKARNLRLVPTGMHNAGELKQPLVMGVEGAAKPGD
ncbi:MAG: hypothetical protein WBC18_04420 [Ottowia sp.]|uniref:hypothetical protein n=1 Tax=unclassified Ottowia TaxID=2645081 RepID=UPI003C2B4D99